MVIIAYIHKNVYLYRKNKEKYFFKFSSFKM